MSFIRVAAATAVAGLLLLAATPSAADDGRYLFVGSDEDGAGFIDLSTMTAGPQPVLKLLYVPRNHTAGDRSAVYFGVVKLRVDCGAKTTALISARSYTDTGDLVQDRGPQPAEPVDPSELPAVNTLRVACKLPGAPNERIFSSSTAAIHWWQSQ